MHSRILKDLENLKPKIEAARKAKDVKALGELRVTVEKYRLAAMDKISERENFASSASALNSTEKNKAGVAASFKETEALKKRVAEIAESLDQSIEEALELSGKSSRRSTTSNIEEIELEEVKKENEEKEEDIFFEEGSIPLSATHRKPTEGDEDFDPYAAPDESDEESDEEEKNENSEKELKKRIAKAEIELMGLRTLLSVDATREDMDDQALAKIKKTATEAHAKIFRRVKENLDFIQNPHSSLKADKLEKYKKKTAELIKEANSIYQQIKDIPFKDPAYRSGQSVPQQPRQPIEEEKEKGKDKEEKEETVISPSFLGSTIDADSLRADPGTENAILNNAFFTAKQMQELNHRHSAADFTQVLKLLTNLHEAVNVDRTAINFNQVNDIVNSLKLTSEEAINLSNEGRGRLLSDEEQIAQEENIVSKVRTLTRTLEQLGVDAREKTPFSTTSRTTRTEFLFEPVDYLQPTALSDEEKGHSEDEYSDSESDDENEEELFAEKDDTDELERAENAALNLQLFNKRNPTSDLRDTLEPLQNLHNELVRIRATNSHDLSSLDDYTNAVLDTVGTVGNKKLATEVGQENQRRDIESAVKFIQAEIRAYRSENPSPRQASPYIHTLDEDSESSDDEERLRPRRRRSQPKNTNPDRRDPLFDPDSIPDFPNFDTPSTTSSTVKRRPRRGAGDRLGSTPVVNPPGGGAPVVNPPGGGAPVVNPPGGGAPVVNPPGGGAPVVNPPGGGAPAAAPVRYNFKQIDNNLKYYDYLTKAILAEAKSGETNAFHRSMYGELSDKLNNLEKYLTFYKDELKAKRNALPPPPAPGANHSFFSKNHEPERQKLKDKRALAKEYLTRIADAKNKIAAVQAVPQASIQYTGTEVKYFRDTLQAKGLDLAIAEARAFANPQPGQVNPLAPVLGLNVPGDFKRTAIDMGAAGAPAPKPFVHKFQIAATIDNQPQKIPVAAVQHYDAASKSVSAALYADIAKLKKAYGDSSRGFPPVEAFAIAIHALNTLLAQPETMAQVMQDKQIRIDAHELPPIALKAIYYTLNYVGLDGIAEQGTKTFKADDDDKRELHRKIHVENLIKLSGPVLLVGKDAIAEWEKKTTPEVEKPSLFKRIFGG